MISKLKIVFIDTVHPILWEELDKAGFVCHDFTHLSSLEASKIVANYDGVVIRSKFKFTREIFDKCKRLKFIARSGSGLENIDTAYASEKGVTVFSSPEGNRDAVAEQVLGMLLMLFNNLKKADTEVRKGEWEREGNRGLELMGKTIALIGYGVVGKATAKRFSGFACEVITYDKYASNYGDEFAREVSLKEVFEKADVVSLHVNYLEDNKHLVNSGFLSSFKKPIFVVNTARGNCLSIEDLMDAIDSGKVLGACLDVLEYEQLSFEDIQEDNLPYAFKRLVQSEKVLLSPHIAGWTKESYIKLSSFLAKKIIASFVQKL